VQLESLQLDADNGVQFEQFFCVEILLGINILDKSDCLFWDFFLFGISSDIVLLFDLKRHCRSREVSTSRYDCFSVLCVYVEDGYQVSRDSSISEPILSKNFWFKNYV